jgi:uncharacterized damage-inducible protein DinB
MSKRGNGSDFCIDWPRSINRSDHAPPRKCLTHVCARQWRTPTADLEGNARRLSRHPVQPLSRPAEEVRSPMRGDELRRTIRSELDATRDAFHAVLDSLSDEDWRQRSHNPGWTNGELLFHMAFAFMILRALIPMVRVWGRLPERGSRPFARLLNALTAPFNVVNALGARIGGRVYTRERLRRRYDRVHESLARTLDTIGDDEWGHGMHYPSRWDDLFDDYMTLEKLFRYPAAHFAFHRAQIRRRSEETTATPVP